VRIIAATNRDIAELARQRKFPPDLYDRVNVLTVRVPPLRERKEDIPILADYFFRRYCQQKLLDYSPEACALCVESGSISCLGPELIPSLLSYDWPGNIRELRNSVIEILTESQGTHIRTSHLPEQIREFACNHRGNSESALNLNVVLKHHLLAVLGKRPKLAVLTADYVKGTSSELAALQGKSSSMRLTGWSAMRVSTSRK